MIILRNVQLVIMELPILLKFINYMCKFFRKHFEYEVDLFNDTTLKKKILKTIKKAQYYKLESKTDWRRFVFLAIEYDWDFDEDPDNEWMVSMLEDPEITNPSDRLTRLIDECAYRKRWQSRMRSFGMSFMERIVMRMKHLSMKILVKR